MNVTSHFLNIILKKTQPLTDYAEALICQDPQ